MRSVTGCTLFSRVIVYNVDHTIGLLRVSRTIHLDTLCTIISIVIVILYTSMDIVKGCDVVIILQFVLGLCTHSVCCMF
jgi:hypothetical protein